MISPKLADMSDMSNCQCYVISENLYCHTTPNIGWRAMLTNLKGFRDYNFFEGKHDFGVEKVGVKF